MDFLDLDKVLPFYVDYLGRFEYDKEENIVSASDALSELLHSGIQEKVYIKNAELNFMNDRLILRNIDRVRLYLMLKYMPGLYIIFPNMLTLYYGIDERKSIFHFTSRQWYAVSTYLKSEIQSPLKSVI